ncbi:protein phosphatase 2C domain-containing protein [Streptomyces sp. NPDC050600]|uniref:protein phosphatase 2C domain-containing protein n=1 Tax=unclassified Streptomyces TaxID=2593676 RepID=UPI00343859C2
MPEAMLTIGDFARASRLSAKALRRYDELGLLPPARVDPFTGYRYYAEEQVEQARLVAWLRRIGMPLAEVGRVCERYATDPEAAARAIRAYWTRVESETAARRDLASSLVDRLKGTTDMSTPTPASAPTSEPTPASAPAHALLRTAVRLDRGLVRASQQDAAHAGPHLLAVADGYGPEGARAAREAVEAAVAAHTDLPDAPGTRTGDVLDALEAGVRGAAAALAELTGSGTTLTAAAWTAGRLAVAHIGDSRAYLLRDGALARLTRDHTVVQALVDAGELDPGEVADRPDRALLLKALDGGDVPPEPEFGVHGTRPGDRLLLCTDGLSAVVPADAIRRVLAEAGDPEATADALIALTRERGGPDNAACVVADVVAA